jgi:hypothetical protein
MRPSRVLGELGQLAFWCCCWDPQRLVETLFLKQLNPSLVERPYKKLNTELYRCLDQAPVDFAALFSSRWQNSKIAGALGSQLVMSTP